MADLKIENFKIVPIEQVAPNPWNPKNKDTEEYHKVVKSIKQNGLLGAISVRRKDGADGIAKYEILDGEQRWTACCELGYDNIVIYDEGELDDKTAQERTIWWQVQVPFDEVKEMVLVTGLLEKYHDLDNLPYSERELTVMEEMKQLPFDTYGESDGQTASDCFSMTFKFNVEEQPDEINMVCDYFNRADASREEILIDLLNKVKKGQL